VLLQVNNKYDFCGMYTQDDSKYHNYGLFIIPTEEIR